MTIRCGCTVAHRDHSFQTKEGYWGLCGFCSHTLGAHQPGVNGQSYQLARLIDACDVATYTITLADGGKRMTIDLVLA